MCPLRDINLFKGHSVYDIWKVLEGPHSGCPRNYQENENDEMKIGAAWTPPPYANYELNICVIFQFGQY